MKRKRKTPRRKRQHPAVGSAINIDRRQRPERRAADIDGRNAFINMGLEP